MADSETPRRENPEKAFLGTGWSFPPTFSKADYSVVMASDDQDIQESLWIIFSTTLGERIMLPDFGSQLWEMVFQAITTTLMSRLQDIVRKAILNWEPRIDVDEIIVERDATVDGLVTITVEYTIRKTNSRSNLVYPFYTQEGTIPASGP